MPLYEYQCSACRERSEILQKISDPPYTRCPKCGGEMKKLFSSPAIQFKGSGFYKTDYASSSSSSSKSDSKNESKSESKSEGSSESKSESKTESKPSSSE